MESHKSPFITYPKLFLILGVDYQNEKIFTGLYQFSSYVPLIDLSFHQYLLEGDEPVLIHTGNIDQTRSLLQKLEAVLGSRKLKYIFGSHFEADEFGGLRVILDRYPDVKAVCSKVSSRQLSGFGFDVETLVKNPGERLSTGSYDLEFISYPSEMHLWEGLLAVEHKHGIFFSADLMIRRGESAGVAVDSNWKDEVTGITADQSPNAEQRQKLKDTLLKLSPKFVATGHGPCLNLTS